MIVLNGEPFTRYNLRTIYTFAYEIIVVEGACPAARNCATLDGHSSDGTLNILHDFRSHEDPEHKLTIITAEDEGHPDGFWSEKDEMSQAYAKRATGNYLWQVDMDEFYHARDIQRVILMLAEEPEVKSISFRAVQFWGGLGYRTDGTYLRKGAQDFHRLFAWGPGYRYVTHRPPTVVDEQGRNLRNFKWLTAGMLVRQGIYMYHYSFVFPFQVQSKFDYHYALDGQNGLSSCVLEKRKAWLRNYFELRSPFLIDDTSVVSGPSWIRSFRGEHPEGILQLWNDIIQEKIMIERRGTEDIERLLATRWYRIATWLLVIIRVPFDLARNIAVFILITLGFKKQVK